MSGTVLREIDAMWEDEGFTAAADIDPKLAASGSLDSRTILTQLTGLTTATLLEPYESLRWRSTITSVNTSAK